MRTVGGVGLPAVGGGDRRVRLAGVALVHRDHAKIGGGCPQPLELQRRAGLA